MTQENKALKITGVIKGLTQFDRSLDRSLLVTLSLNLITAQFLTLSGLEKRIKTTKGKNKKRYQLTGTTILYRYFSISYLQVS